MKPTFALHIRNFMETAGIEPALCSRRGWLAVRAAWWALDWCRYWLTPTVIRRHLTDRGY